ncbi:Innexin inx3 [Araneus ventricosus]|uniref:Innexin n=1 Tax=Araneus ventricosus TaxID=182803 RepID=A0A4Y2INT6_ARAVE|nr:Innexin inx3 [Araneus ventricosus]
MLRNAYVRLVPKRILAENFIFHLHYRWTVILLLVCSFITTCRLILGHSFSCLSIAGYSQEQLETHCYADYVYSLPVQLLKHHVVNSDSSIDPAVHGFRRYQEFYPWVNLLFLIHAFNFYLPHLLWKYYDSGYMTRLISGLELAGGKDDKRGFELCYLAKYVLATQGKHKLYTGMYIFCEVLNYSIALAHTLWLVHFFIVTGVPEFLPIQVSTWSDFRKFYFPPTGVCSVTVNKTHHQTTCFLPLNKLYMIMFLFIHAWYIFLTIVSGMVLLYRIILLFPSQRVAVMKFSAPWAEKETLKSLCHRLSYSDWFFLIRFQRVMTDIDFAQMLDKIAIVSACKTCDQNDEDNRSSFISDDGHKELGSSTATSPV